MFVKSNAIAVRAPCRIKRKSVGPVILLCRSSIVIVIFFTAAVRLGEVSEKSIAGLCGLRDRRHIRVVFCTCRASARTALRVQRDRVAFRTPHRIKPQIISHIVNSDRLSVIIIIFAAAAAPLGKVSAEGVSGSDRRRYGRQILQIFCVCSFSNAAAVFRFKVDRISVRLSRSDDLNITDYLRRVDIDSADRTNVLIAGYRCAVYLYRYILGKIIAGVRRQLCRINASVPGSGISVRLQMLKSRGCIEDRLVRYTFSRRGPDRIRICVFTIVNDPKVCNSLKYEIKIFTVVAESSRKIQRLSVG